MVCKPKSWKVWKFKVKNVFHLETMLSKAVIDTKKQRETKMMRTNKQWLSAASAVLICLVLINYYILYLSSSDAKTKMMYFN